MKRNLQKGVRRSDQWSRSGALESSVPEAKGGMHRGRKNMVSYTRYCLEEE